MASRKLSIAAAVVIVSLISLSVFDNYLAVPIDLSIYNNSFGGVLFIVTVVIGYGVGSWFLLKYTKEITMSLRTKYPFINTFHTCVTIIQFSLLGMLLFLIYNRNDVLLNLVFIISSISASTILGLLSFKFFAWYKTSYKNRTLLYFGLATSTLAAAILANIGTHSLLVEVVQEVKKPGSKLVPFSPISPSTMNFVQPYVCKDGNCAHEIQSSIRMMKDIRNHTTVFYIVPASKIFLRNYMNIIPYTLGQIFRWVCIALLLLHYYPRVNRFKFWALISIPLIFYLIAKAPLALGLPQPYWFMVLQNTGNTAITIIFGILLFMTARKVQSVKDYLTIAAIGIILGPISLSTSVLQETFGLAAHSLVLLSTYLFSVGLYCSAISIAQDTSLRLSVRRSMMELLDKIGTAQMEQDLCKRIEKLAKDNQENMQQMTGISSSLTEDDIKQYMTQVLNEIHKKE